MDNILHPRNKTLLGTSQLFKMDQKPNTTLEYFITS